MVEENFTDSCNLTLRNILHMDDFIFLVNCLEDAQKITDEAISLFRNHDFKLVKWSTNKKPKIVLLFKK